MSDIKIRKLSIIGNNKGDVLKGFLKSENRDIDIKEVYFSEINPNEIKAWKKHKKMTSNLIAVKGEIKIVIQKKDKSFITEIISKKNYKMVSIPPNFWFGFKCTGSEVGMLVNISNEEHDDLESDQLDIEKIVFDWK